MVPFEYDLKEIFSEGKNKNDLSVYIGDTSIIS